MSSRFNARQSNPLFDRDFVIGIRIEIFNQNPFTLQCLSQVLNAIKSSLGDYEIIDERNYGNAIYIYLLHRKAKELIEKKRQLIEQLLSQVQ